MSAGRLPIDQWPLEIANLHWPMVNLQFNFPLPSPPHEGEGAGGEDDMRVEPSDAR